MIRHITDVDTLEDLSVYLGLRESQDTKELRAFISLTIKQGNFSESRELLKEYTQYIVDGIAGKFSHGMIALDIMKAVIYHQADNSLGFKKYLRDAKQHVIDDGMSDIETLIEELEQAGRIASK
jgi:hypothetical protein